MIIDIDDRPVTICSEKCAKAFHTKPVPEKVALAAASVRGHCVICNKNPDAPAKAAPAKKPKK
jgi:hypothetical protein